MKEVTESTNTAGDDITKEKQAVTENACDTLDDGTPEENSLSLHIRKIICNSEICDTTQINAMTMQLNKLFEKQMKKKINDIKNSPRKNPHAIIPLLSPNPILSNHQLQQSTRYINDLHAAHNKLIQSTLESMKKEDGFEMTPSPVVVIDSDEEATTTITTQTEVRRNQVKLLIF